MANAIIYSQTMTHNGHTSHLNTLQHKQKQIEQRATHFKQARVFTEQSHVTCSQGYAQETFYANQFCVMLPQRPGRELEGAINLEWFYLPFFSQLFPVSFSPLLKKKRVNVTFFPQFSFL